MTFLSLNMSLLSKRASTASITLDIIQDLGFKKGEH